VECFERRIPITSAQRRQAALRHPPARCSEHQPGIDCLQPDVRGV
jgi:hypothetical protein